LKHLLLLIIIAITNEFFDLTPRLPLSGFLSLRSIALLLIVTSLFFLLLRKRAGIERVNNPFSWLILAFLSFQIIQVSVASMRFDQSIINGLIGARDMGFALMFFVFLLLYRNDKETIAAMKVLTIIAIGVGLLAVINYFGPELLYFKKDRDLTMRADILRAHVPAELLIVCAFLWCVSKLSIQRKPLTIWLPTAIFLYGVILLSQIRMQMIATVVAVFCGLLLFRQHKKFLLLGTVALIGISILSLTLQTNPLISGFKTAATDVLEESGTWRGRASQMKHSWQTFVDNMWTGSGGAAIRVSTVESQKKDKMYVEHYQADLGYMHLLKYYGIFFVIWFLVFSYYVIRACYMAINRDSEAGGSPLCRYAIIYFIYFYFSLITQNHFTIYPKLIIFMISLAVLHSCTSYNRAGYVETAEVNSGADGEKLTRHYHINGI